MNMITATDSQEIAELTGNVESEQQKFPAVFVTGERLMALIIEIPKLDTSSYLSNYAGEYRKVWLTVGRTLLERAKLIGTCSKHLGEEALRIGYENASTGIDATAYREFQVLLSDRGLKDDSLAGGESTAYKMEQVAQRETERLENDLKGYKNNLIKESIRLGNDDLGQHYYQCGNFAEAFKAFSRMREYCTMPKHAAEMSMKIVLTGVAQRNWMNVQSHIYKLQGANLKTEDRALVDPVLAPLSGLVFLASGSFKDAAGQFLQTNPSFGVSGKFAGIESSRDIISPNDVAIYGGLCALATLPRVELLSRVLENTNFRGFLELESHLRRAIVNFCSAKYTQCLEILESYRADYLLDIYLQPHIDALYRLIRRKSIAAYCLPFSKVSISVMGETFGVGTAAMESELYDMIRSGELDARLDLSNMILVAKEEDERTSMQQKALKAADEHERQLRLRLFRLNMLQHGFDLRGTKKDGGEALKSRKVNG